MSPGNLPEALLQRLALLRNAPIYRQVRSSSGGIDFVSNDYLNLSTQPFAQTSGYPAGSGGSRLLSGNHPAHVALEEKCASWLKAESTLLFPSGYTANIGLLSCLGQRNDLFILDEEVHASIKDGVRLSLANHCSFRHNDLDSLAKKLARPCKGTRYVVAESVYSMSGDLAPLREVSALCRQSGTFLIVDEAHSTGIMGDEGAGYVVHLGIQDEVLARVHCFGKAVGRSGAVVAGSHNLIDLLVNTSRSFIYTTAPSPMAAFDLMHQINLVRKADFLRKRLETNTTYFRQRLNLPDTGSPIVFWTCGDAISAKVLAARIQEHGCDIRAIVHPTVREGKEGVRIIIHAGHSMKELDVLATLLSIQERG